MVDKDNLHFIIKHVTLRKSNLIGAANILASCTKLLPDTLVPPKKHLLTMTEEVQAVGWIVVNRRLRFKLAVLQRNGLIRTLTPRKRRVDGRYAKVFSD